MRAIKYRTQKNVFSPLIYVSPLWISPLTDFSPYECAQGRISLFKNVHKSHIEMMKEYTLPFCHEETNESRGRWERKEDMTRIKNDAWGVQDEWENEAQT